MAFTDRKLPKEMNFLKRQEHLCHLTILAGYLCVLINFVALVSVWAGIVLPLHMDYSIGYYWAYYILFPSLLMLAVVGLVDFFIRRENISLIVKQYSVLLLLVFCLAFMIIVHKIALVLLASFVIPVFISTVFSQPRMTRNIFFICFGLIIICTLLIIPDISSRIENGYVYVELISALGILSSSYVFSRILINYSMEYHAMLKVSFEMQSKMHTMIQSDLFTGLYNRSTFDEFLSAFVNDSFLTKESVTLAAFDLDNFKSINDSYGHAKGDQVLLYFSRLLKAKEKPNVFAFRFGGDEFAMICKHLDLQTISNICESLLREVNQNASTVLGVPISFSCGISSFHAPMKDASSFFNAVDKALYAAKQGGKNQIVIADNELKPKTKDLESEQKRIGGESESPDMDKDGNK